MLRSAASRSRAPTCATSTPGPTLYAHKEDVARAARVGREALHDLDRAAALRCRDATLHTQVVATGDARRAGRLARRPLPQAAPATRPSARRRSTRSRRRSPRRPGSAASTDRCSATSRVFDSLRGSSRTGFARRSRHRRRPERRRGRPRLLAATGRRRRRPRAGWRRRCARRASASTARAARAPRRPRRPEIAGVDSPPIARPHPPDERPVRQLRRRDAAEGPRRALRRGPGTTSAGAAVVRAQLATFGVHPRIVDGSGPLARRPHDAAPGRPAARAHAGHRGRARVRGLAAGRRADRARCAGGCAARSRRTAARRRPGRCARSARSPATARRPAAAPSRSRCSCRPCSSRAPTACRTG